MKQFLLRICRLIYKSIGVASPLFRVLVIHSDIESLKRNKKHSEARNLRHKSLKIYNKKYLSPLWRQEGFDLLYEVKDYQQSLMAFEKAMETLPLSTALYGVANPLDIYFGASMAAISAEQYEKAEKYYFEFKKLFDSYSLNPKLASVMKNYREGMNWIENSLLQDIENK